MYKIYLIDDNPNACSEIKLCSFSYLVDSINEYPSAYMLTSYEKDDFYGLRLGPGGIPDPTIDQLEYHEHRVGKNVIDGVKHKFFTPKKV